MPPSRSKSAARPFNVKTVVPTGVNCEEKVVIKFGNDNQGQEVHDNIQNGMVCAENGKVHNLNHNDYHALG